MTTESSQTALRRPLGRRSIRRQRSARKWTAGEVVSYPARVQAEPAGRPLALGVADAPAALLDELLPRAPLRTSRGNLPEPRGPTRHGRAVVCLRVEQDRDVVGRGAPERVVGGASRGEVRGDERRRVRDGREVAGPGAVPEPAGAKDLGRAREGGGGACARGWGLARGRAEGREEKTHFDRQGQRHGLGEFYEGRAEEQQSGRKRSAQVVQHLDELAHARSAPRPRRRVGRARTAPANEPPVDVLEPGLPQLLRDVVALAGVAQREQVLEPPERGFGAAGRWCCCC